jgi:hypothetical protein
VFWSWMASGCGYVLGGGGFLTAGRFPRRLTVDVWNWRGWVVGGRVGRGLLVVINISPRYGVLQW